MNVPTRPFDDIRALVGAMPGPDAAALAAVRAREAQLAKPAGSLGRLEEIVEWLAAWQGAARPRVEAPLVAIFAGAHGVAAHDVSRFPPSATPAMVGNFSSGGAAINQICKTFDISLKVFELALERPTGDITREAALDEKACAATMAFGMEALAAKPDLLRLGEMGVGATTVAAAIDHALYGGEAEDWVGRGASDDDARLRRKADAVRAAVARHREHLSDPLEVLRRLERAAFG
jgi:nicotinate-nucleotide--dimethylbenzimidazole phosphoribosyltransferase